MQKYSCGIAVRHFKTWISCAWTKHEIRIKTFLQKSNFSRADILPFNARRGKCYLCTFCCCYRRCCCCHCCCCCFTIVVAVSVVVVVAITLVVEERDESASTWTKSGIFETPPSAAPLEYSEHLIFRTRDL